MLGEKIGEEKGKVTSRRVLPNPGGGPKIETNAQSNLTLLGVEAVNNVTYWAVVRPDGTLYGEGQGIVISKQGDVATWVGQGAGTMRSDGGASFRGAVYYQTTSPKWTRLNSIASIFEHEVDAEGNVHSNLWEWK
jgi:hypothetical protein